MRRSVGIVLAGLLLAPAMALAQVQPHRAEYALRLGVGSGAPRIGTAVNDLKLDCAGWHLTRDIKTEIALTASWKMRLASTLDGEETRSGNRFRFSTRQSQNGSEREARGRVERRDGEVRAEIVRGDGPADQLVLPAPTMMPVAAVEHLVGRLQAKALSFPALMFDAEVLGDAFLVEVTEQEGGPPRASKPGAKGISGLPSKSWPVFMSFTRGRSQQQEPLFTVSALVFENGVLDRLTVETGLVTVTADLQSLEMRPFPSCPRS